MNKPYRILSLDGGGTWALIQAKTLAMLYPNLDSGHKVLSQFDLATANSGGSIVLAGLVADLSPATILTLFKNEEWRKKLFVELPLYRRIARIIGLGPRFSTTGKMAGLKEALGKWGEKTLNQATADIAALFPCPELLITSFQYDRQPLAIFRSNLTSKSASKSTPAQPTLCETVNASSTAPVNFFDRPAQVLGWGYWDGAMSGVNNPLLVGVIEALANGVDIESIRALSIGTGGTFLPIAKDGQPPIYAPLEEPGLIADIKKAALCILDDPPDAASYMSHIILGGKVPANGEVVTKTQVIRMNPMVQPVLINGRYAVPSGLTESDFDNLQKTDIAAVDSEPVALIEKFCDSWMNLSAVPLSNPVPNQPIRANGQTLALEIGHGSFAEARTAWLNP